MIDGCVSQKNAQFCPEFTEQRCIHTVAEADNWLNEILTSLRFPLLKDFL